MRVAIIGCGLIGKRRARALGECQLVACCDTIAERAQALASDFPRAEATSDWYATATRRDIEIVLVATTHNMLAGIAAAAAAAGKHVLIEKPAACRPAELDPVIEASGPDRRHCQGGLQSSLPPGAARGPNNFRERCAG